MTAQNDPIRYPLKRKNYDDLILADVLAPRILVLVMIPQDIGEWMVLSVEQLVLRRCGYWVSLAGQPQSENETSVTVSVPRANVLTVDASQADAADQRRKRHMKVAVQDSATLRALKPLELAAYLRAKGWRQEADLAGKGSLWLLQGPSGAEFDVTLPARRELGDYVLRMAEVLSTLADAEGRSQLDVLRDIQITTADLIRVRAPSRDAEDGTLPLDRAVAFVERSRDIAGRGGAAIDKRLVFAKRKAQQAMDYLDHARMGHNERGSYVY